MRPPGDRGGTPLAATFERLAALDDEGEETVLEIGRPRGGRWLRLDALADGGLDLLLSEAAERAPGRRDFPGAAVASSLAGALVTAGWPPLLLERRLPLLHAANLSVRRHESGSWLDGIALADPRCAVLPGDPDAGHPDVEVVADLAALHQRFAEALVATATPWFAAIRARASFGLAGMWGQAVDLVTGSALWTARRAGVDGRAAWDEATAVTELVAQRVPELRARARLFPVPWRGGEELFQVRGVCCLWYRTHDAPDRCGDGYCTTCPLRPDDVRAERLSSWLAASEGRA